MERRKFIAGLGSLTAAGAAGIGTSAFTSVNADRSVDVEVAGDANAYLGLEPISSSPNSQYVQVNSGEVSLDFSSSNPNTGGSNTTTLGDGFNPDAVTWVDNLLRVSNQGTQAVDFSIDISSFNTGSATVEIQTMSGSTDLTDPSNSVSISPGNSVDLQLKVDTSGQGPASTSGTITFVADAN